MTTREGPTWGLLVPSPDADAVGGWSAEAVMGCDEKCQAAAACRLAVHGSSVYEGVGRMGANVAVVRRRLLAGGCPV